MKEQLCGMIANIPMVYDEQDGIDEETLLRNIRAYVEEGFKAIYVMGSSGEYFAISPDEYRRVVQVFAREAGPDILKVVGCGWPRLGETVETVQWLNGSGIDCVLAIPPFLIPLSSEERTNALRSIAKACPSLGVVHYNTDYAPSVRFSSADYASLLDVPNFWGTKQGSLTTEFWNELREQAPRLRHLSLDDWLVPAMKVGGYGAFSLLTSLAPRFALRWFEACESEDWTVAEAMEEEFNRFVNDLYLPLSQRSYTYVAVDKAMIDCFGFLTAGNPRPPLKPVSLEDKRWLAERIEEGRYFQEIP